MNTQTNQKPKHKTLSIVILIIVLVVVLGICSYFGFEWYKTKQIEQPISSEPKVTEYNPNENPQYWPDDFPIDSNIKPLTSKQTQYNDNLIISEKTFESSYPELPTYNYFKDYLDLNYWQITKEDQENYYIAAKREGYISVKVLPDSDNKSIAYVEYQHMPNNPIESNYKTFTKQLPQIFDIYKYDYLIYKNSKIGGYIENKDNYDVILFSTDTVESIYNYYIKTLQTNNWNVVNTSTSNIGANIKAQKEAHNIELNIKQDQDKNSSIDIILNKD